MGLEDAVVLATAVLATLDCVSFSSKEQGMLMPPKVHERTKSTTNLEDSVGADDVLTTVVAVGLFLQHVSKDVLGSPVTTRLSMDDSDEGKTGGETQVKLHDCYGQCVKGFNGKYLLV